MELMIWLIIIVVPICLGYITWDTFVIAATIALAALYIGQRQ